MSRGNKYSRAKTFHLDKIFQRPLFIQVFCWEIQFHENCSKLIACHIVSPKSLWNFLSQIRHFTWFDEMEIPKAFLCKTQHLQISATLHLLYNIGINLNSKHCLNSLSHTTPHKKTELWNIETEQLYVSGEDLAVARKQREKWGWRVGFSSTESESEIFLRSMIFLLRLFGFNNYPLKRDFPAKSGPRQLYFLVEQWTSDHQKVWKFDCQTFQHLNQEV